MVGHLVVRYPVHVAKVVVVMLYWRFAGDERDRWYTDDLSVQSSGNRDRRITGLAVVVCLGHDLSLISNASRTSGVVIDVAARQPTIRRE